MVQFSVKGLLFSATLLALSLDGIYAADTAQCREVDNPCGGANAQCCDGLKCLGYSYSGFSDGVCRPAADDKPKCKAVDTPCGGERSKCCDGLECLGYSYTGMPDGVCRPAKPDSPVPPPPEETPNEPPPPDNGSGKGDGKKCLLGIDLLCL